jgi:hypothetical protein
MIYTRRHDHQIILVQLDPHPVVILVAHIKVSSSIHNVSNLLVFVKMLIEEHLDLAFVLVSHGRRGNGDYVSVLIATRSRERVDILNRRVVEVSNAELGEIFLRNFTARVVRFTLVAL